MVTAIEPLENEEVTLRDLILAVWAGRWLVLILTILTTVAAGAAALLLPKEYEAATVISPVSSTNTPGQGGGSLSSLISQFGGLASLAGLSISEDAKKAESLAVLQSESLTEQYIRQNNLLPILFAKKWNASTGTWKSMDPAQVPTLWKANELFRKKVRSVAVDSKTGLATMTITWVDPRIAAQWANGLVALANQYLRDQAIEESEKNIAYLTSQAAKTDEIGVKQAIYTILQSEIYKVMLARGNDEYALKVLDPAFAPGVKSSPKLSIWLPVGFVGGLILGCFVLFLRKEWQSGARSGSRGIAADRR